MKHFLLILILILATILRFWSLSVFPAGLNADEAALGYNAYSLLLTGKDEHGHVIPVNLESFGDYKPALYSYLLVPLIKVLGLTEFAVRIPSALFGILAVYLIYVLAKTLTGSNKVADFSGLLLAISPWHLHFSRGAWEVNVSTTLLLLGLIFFLRWVKNGQFFSFALCTLNFSLAMYTYQSARILAPVLGISLAWLYRRHLFARVRHAASGLVLLVVVLTPLGLSLLFTDAASRVGGVGLLADEGPVNFVREVRGQSSGLNSVWSRFLYNRPVIYSLQFLKNYLSHFDGDFLFVNGDAIERNRVPETGLLYFTDFLLLGFGLVSLSKSWILKPKTHVIFLWLFVAPLASALTFQVPHALRAQNMVIPMTLIQAAGIYQIVTMLVFRPTWFKFTAYSLLLTVYMFQFTRYLHQYFVHYPQTYPAAWEYGYKELVSYITANQKRYDRVLITDKYDQPYILFLFYSRFDPRRFQGNHELTIRDKYNFSTVRIFDKYIFTDTNWDQVRDMHGSLIAASGEDLPEVGVNIVYTINFPNGRAAFKIVSN